MTQLSEERFKEILTKELAPLATRQDVREGVEELARIVSSGFDDVQKRLDVVDRVKKPEADMSQIKQALYITA